MHDHTQLLHDLTCLELSARREQRVVAALSAINDWNSLLSDLEFHGLSPIFFKHASTGGLNLKDEHLIALRALNMRHRAATQARYKAYTELHRAFAEQSLPLVALKGLALAPAVYPEDHLRPMRDIDLLVERGSLKRATQIMRECGYDLPDQQPTAYMRDAHQLPEAGKDVDGFRITVEIHHDAIGRDIVEHLYYEDVQDELRSIGWAEQELCVLDHELMLHQLCRHLQGLHPGDRIKLINVLDIVVYAEKFEAQIDWHRLALKYSHVLNTLRCLHLITPLSDMLQNRLSPMPRTMLDGVGQPMIAMRRIITSNSGLLSKLQCMLRPSKWWLHLYYNVNPNKNLFWVQFVRHPIGLISWGLRRSYAGIFGGVGEQ